MLRLREARATRSSANDAASNAREARCLKRILCAIHKVSDSVSPVVEEDSILLEAFTRADSRHRGARDPDVAKLLNPQIERACLAQT